ncbi:MAG: hypothetical protein KI785_13600 [Devosiaceae bacterium]|nr:hypothetical protein [Devosiaceae bacterium MH13]
MEADLDDVFDVRAILGFLRRQAWLIVLCGLVATTLAVAIVLQIPSRYTATALLLVDTSVQRLVDTEALNGSPPSAAGVVESQVEMLMSDAILRRAVRDTGISLQDLEPQGSGFVGQLFGRLSRSVEALPDPLSAETLMVETLREHARIARRGLTFVIAVSVENVSPQGAALLANAITDAYIREQVDAKIAAARSAEAALSARVSDLAIDLRAIESQVDGLLLSAALESLDRLGPEADPAKRQVVSELSRLAAERQALFSERADLTNAIRSRDVTAMLARSDDQMVTTLQGRQRELSERLDAAISAGARDRSDLRSSLAQVEGSLFDAAERRRAEIDERLASLDAATLDARQQLRTFLDLDALQSTFALDLFTLQEEAETTRGVYISALERLKQAEINASVQVPDARVLSRATPPLERSYPSRSLYAAAGLLLGLMLGGGIGLVREQMFAGIVETASVERNTDMAVVTMVPVVSGASGGAPHTLIASRPMSTYTESIKRLSLSLESFRLPSEQAVSVLITSANPNDGKSTLALSLSLLAASSGRRTLLVDADFRKPSIFGLLGMETDGRSGAPQFSDLLTGTMPLEQIADIGVRDPKTGLNVLGNVTSPHEATDGLVGGARFAWLIDAARSAYDLIVIDSPPILPVVDARILTRYADVAVFALRFGRTTLPNVRTSLRELDQLGSPPVVGALNFVDPKSSRGYESLSYYGYGYGYGYGAGQGSGYGEKADSA